MSPQLHQRVRKRFDEALGLPEGERLPFLEAACRGEPEVLEAVRRLLDAHRDAVGFLATDNSGGQRFGRYIITRELGRGAMGVVYEAFDPLIGRDVAVKVIGMGSLAGIGKPGFVAEQLFREAHSAGRLLHPGIVVIFDVGQEGDSAFIAMELVEGRSLLDLLAANRKPPVGEVLDILRQAAAALDYAHQNDIVHRDIKPANIMLHKDRGVKIADFGVAKITSMPHHTTTGLVQGTPTYMSPEQVGMRPLDGRSDQFSLTVVAYEMLTGYRPFEGDSIATLAHCIVYGERPSARAANPALPEGVDAVLQKGLAMLPEQRYATCVELVDALGVAISAAPSAAAATPKRATPAAAPARARSRVTRTALYAAAAFAGIAVAVALALAGGLWMNRPRPGKTAAPQAVAPPPVVRPAAPAVARFTSSSSSIVAGTAVLLQWEVKDATAVRIEPQVGSVAPSGAMEVRPAQSTTYKLAAQGPGGEISASLAIEATPKPPAPKPAEKGEAQYKKAVALRQSGQEEMALALFRQAAEQGYIPAMLEVGEATMEVESGESLLWFRRAADLGDVTGMLHVGAIYQLGIQVEKDYDRAAFWYRQAAEKGNPAAMYNLGRMYESGLGVNKDMDKARSLYRQAAAAGNHDAIARLGVLAGK